MKGFFDVKMTAYVLLPAAGLWCSLVTQEGLPLRVIPSGHPSTAWPSMKCHATPSLRTVATLMPLFGPLYNTAGIEQSYH